MAWFLDPVPDPDRVEQVADTLRALHVQQSDQVKQVQRAHEATQAVWIGPASQAHTTSTAATQQVARQNPAWLVALADAFAVLGTLLRLVMYLMMAWWALQAATVIWGIVGFFTAGAGLAIAGDTEAAAIEVQAGIQAARLAVETLLKTLASALSRELVQAGVVLGGAMGAGVGIQDAQATHETGWQALATIFSDAGKGALDGGLVALNPVALLGTGVGVGEVATRDATSGQPFDVQSAFDLVSADTWAAATIAAALPSEPDSMFFSGARGTWSGRPFDPDLAGGPIADPPLTTDGVQITPQGVQQVEQHVWRFAEPGQGLDPPIDAMLGRLKQIADGQVHPTQYDLNFYTHELDEYGRYQNLGWPTGQPSDPTYAYDLWNNTHTAALMDYRLPEFVLNPAGQREWQLFDPSLWATLGR